MFVSNSCWWPGSWHLHVHLETTFLLMYEQPSTLDWWCSGDLLRCYCQQKFNGLLEPLLLESHWDSYIEESFCLSDARGGHHSSPIQQEEMEDFLNMAVNWWEAAHVLLWWRHVADDDCGELNLPSGLSNWLPSQRGQTTSVADGDSDEAKTNEPTVHQALVLLFTHSPKRSHIWTPPLVAEQLPFVFNEVQMERGRALRDSLRWFSLKPVQVCRLVQSDKNQLIAAARDGVLVTHVNVCGLLGDETVALITHHWQ